MTTPFSELFTPPTPNAVELTTFQQGGAIAELAAVAQYSKRTGIAEGPSLLIFREAVGREPQPRDTMPDDPAFMLLMDDGHRTDPDESIYRDACYICRDPEYALMGLPLCKPCGKCGGHVAADSIVCDDCGHDAMEDYVFDPDAD